MAEPKTITYTLEVDSEGMNSLELQTENEERNPSNFRKVLANKLADMLYFPPELYQHYLARWTELTRFGLEKMAISGFRPGNYSLGTITQEAKWGTPVIVKIAFKYLP